MSNNKQQATTKNNITYHRQHTPYNTLQQQATASNDQQSTHNDIQPSALTGHNNHKTRCTHTDISKHTTTTNNQIQTTHSKQQHQTAHHNEEPANNKQRPANNNQQAETIKRKSAHNDLQATTIHHQESINDGKKARNT